LALPEVKIRSSTNTEKLDKGEVLIAQFTDNTSAIKIRGKARILSRHGEVYSGE